MIKYIVLLLSLYTFSFSIEESCTKCHKNTTDIDNFHKIDDFGCSSCHGGDKTATTKIKAHKNIVLNPAQLNHAQIFCKPCHKNIVNRVEKSIMNTQSGIIDVLRFQFKETKTILKTNGIEDIKNISTQNQSLAQDHFSKLCAACHIDQDEKIFKTYTPRGGGCVDCHRKNDKKEILNITDKFKHPQFTTKIPNKTCLKCHNRSNRIGLSYIGKFESEGYGTPYKNGKLTHKLDKNRYYYPLPSDIHHKKGLNCIDCHTHKGIMGDGKKHLHMEDAVDIECKDCHKAKFKSSSLYPKASILAVLNGDIPYSDIVAITNRKNTALYNLTKENNSTIFYTKTSGKKLSLTQMSNNPYHSNAIHKRLDCTACHSSWIPSCYGCHEVYFKDGKQYDWIKHKKTKGKWMELRSYLRYESPALAIGYNNKIMPTAPGCQVIMNIYDKKTFDKNSSFHSFAYATWDPHTTQKHSRKCVDCHTNPQSLGLGAGILKLAKNSIKFTPYFQSNKNGLNISYPIDALIDTNGTQFQTFSRDNARGFNKTEIKNIVNAYRCIVCHDKWDDPIYKDFDKSKQLFKSIPNHIK